MLEMPLLASPAAAFESDTRPIVQVPVPEIVISVRVPSPDVLTLIFASPAAIMPLMPLPSVIILRTDSPVPITVKPPAPSESISILLLPVPMFVPKHTPSDEISIVATLPLATLPFIPAPDCVNSNSVVKATPATP